eukprot:scpid108435/ scgid27298/ 
MSLQLVRLSTEWCGGCVAVLAFIMSRLVFASLAYKTLHAQVFAKLEYGSENMCYDQDQKEAIVTIVIATWSCDLGASPCAIILTCKKDSVVTHMLSTCTYIGCP